MSANPDQMDLSEIFMTLSPDSPTPPHTRPDCGGPEHFPRIRGERSIPMLTDSDRCNISKEIAATHRVGGPGKLEMWL